MEGHEAEGGGKGRAAGAKAIIAWDKSGASGAEQHVKPAYQDEAHAPRRKTLDNLKFPSYCLGDLSAADVKEYLKYSDTILVPPNVTDLAAIIPGKKALVSSISVFSCKSIMRSSSAAFDWTNGP